MKRYILIAAAVLYSGSFLFAQDFRAGIFAGVIGSQLSGDNLSGFNKPGLTVGAFANRQLSEKTGLEFQLSYIQKGSRKQTHPDKGDLTFYLLRLNYLEVPVLYKKKIRKFTYEIGPSVAALIKSSVQDQYGYLPPGSTEARPFKKLDVCINAGINIPLGKKLEMNWRWSNSLLPIRDNLSTTSGTRYFYLFDWWYRGQYSTLLNLNFRYTFGGKKVAGEEVKP